MDLITPSLGFIVWSSVVFVILLFLLSKYAWKPIINAVNEREEKIEDALNQAEKARSEMANLKAENERIIKEAKVQRDAILKEAREIKEKIVSEAKEEATLKADRLIESAKAAIQNEKMAAMTDLKNQIAHLSIDMAENILKKELSHKGEQEQLVKELMEEVSIN